MKETFDGIRNILGVLVGVAFIFLLVGLFIIPERLMIKTFNGYIFSHGIDYHFSILIFIPALTLFFVELFLFNKIKKSKFWVSVKNGFTRIFWE